MLKLFSAKFFAIAILFLFIFSCAANRKSKTTGDVIAKITAIKKMGEKRSLKSVKYLIKEFKNSDSDAVRLEAAKSLGKIGDIRAIPVLERAVAEEKNQSIKDIAKEALISINKINSKKQKKEK